MICSEGGDHYPPMLKYERETLLTAPGGDGGGGNCPPTPHLNCILVLDLPGNVKSGSQFLTACSLSQPLFGGI